MIWAQALQASLPKFLRKYQSQAIFWGRGGGLHPLEQIPSSESLQTFQGPEGHQTVTSTTLKKKIKAVGDQRMETYDGSYGMDFHFREAGSSAQQYC